MDYIIDNNHLITITEEKVKRVTDGEVLRLFHPDPELRIFKSIYALRKEGVDTSDLIDYETAKLNPKRFIPVK